MTPMPRRLPALVSVLYAVLLLVFAVYVVERSLDEHLSNLFFDDWRNLYERSRHSLLRWLFLPHNGHLIPATRLLLHWDYEHFGARGVLPISVSFLCTGTTSALLYAFLRRFPVDDPFPRRALATFFVFALLWSGLYYGFLWGFSVHASLTLMWTSASLCCLAAFALRDPDRPPGANRSLPILALACAVAASLSSASGMGVWAGLLAIALASKLPIRLVIAILAAAGATGALLASARSGPGSNAEHVFLSLQQPDRLVASMLSFLGGPVAWTVDGWLGTSKAQRYQISLGGGAFGLLLALGCAARALRRAKALDAPGLLGLALIAYGAAVSLLVGLGRSWMTTDLANARFTPFSLLFWMGIASTLASVLYGMRHWRARVLLGLLLPAASIAMLPAAQGALERHRRVEHMTTTQLLMVLVGIRSDEIMGALGWSAEASRGLLPVLERDGRGPFADPRRGLLGRNLYELYEVAGARRCGRIRSWKEVDAGAGESGASIRGIATLAQEGSTLSSVLVVDGRGVIRGLGNPDREKEDGSVRWYAYLGPHERNHRFLVYAALDDGSVCRLGAARTAKRSKR